ncbi:hypothetical protein [Acidovorax delafieldii]|uniref:hypothetical protein n=1 Tax=Acidovorax delafieldii TaxID=47920 RepID=UPI003ECE0462
MELFIVIAPILVAGYFYRRKRPHYGSHAIATEYDAQDSHIDMDFVGVRDARDMNGDGKDGLRDVGKVGL